MSTKSAKVFFTQEERQRIEEAVRAAELRTSGEIVPMVVDASYDYPRAEILGGGLLALALAVTTSWAFLHESLWHFLWIFAVAYLPAVWSIRALPPLKRRLISPREVAEEVEEKAIVSFVEQGLHRTRDATGILILISLFERRVHVLADKGINDVVPPGTWDGIVEIVTDGVRRDDACNALCVAIARCADLLETNFPRKADDTDELPNLIVG